MTRMFETGEITKLLDVLIGKTEAVGETNEDKRRLDNLKTLIDVTNWCLDGVQFAMASGYGRPEYSMAEISYTAQCALDEYGRWIADILDEQIADRKTEPFDKDINVRSKTEPSFKVDGIGDDDTTIHAIAHLQKVGWLQEHDRALTEPNLILPERMERGERFEVGETIVVMNRDDYYDLLCKSWKDESHTDTHDEAIKAMATLIKAKTEPQNDLLVTEYPQDGEVNLIGRDKTEAVVMAYDTYKELTEPQTEAIQTSPKTIQISPQTDCSWR